MRNKLLRENSGSDKIWDDQNYAVIFIKKRNRTEQIVMKAWNDRGVSNICMMEKQTNIDEESMIL